MKPTKPDERRGGSSSGGAAGRPEIEAGYRV